MHGGELRGLLPPFLLLLILERPGHGYDLIERLSCYELTAKGRNDLRSWMVRLAQLDRVIEAWLRRGAGALKGARVRGSDRYAASRR